MSSTPLRRSGRWVVRHSNAICVVIAAVLVAFFGLSLVVQAVDDHPLSYLDEHVHYDTVLKLHDGKLSYRGALYEEEVVQEWACGVGHQAGGLIHGCGDPLLAVTDVTSGKYTTGYIHYPTYFIGAEVFRHVVEAVFGPHHDLSVYRLFSALVMFLGVVVCGLGAWFLGARRLALIAAVGLPVAVTSITVLGTMVTPNSTAILAGALIAWSGIAWLRRGRGFVWLALATAFASINAVIDSLPAGGFLVLILVGWVAEKFGRRFEGPWRPRLLQFVALAGIVLAPIVLWGRYITASATVGNAEVYGPYQGSGWRTILVGAVQEIFAFHSPWTDWNLGFPPGPSLVSRALRGIDVGLPAWITIIVVGGLVFALLRTNFADRVTVARASDMDHTRLLSPLHMLALGTLVTVILYPAALRISNALTFGIDFGIVSRYSIAFAPLMIFLLLLVVRQRRLDVVLAVLGTVGMIASVGVWL